MSLLRDLGRCRAFVGAIDDFDAAVELIGDDVPVVEEGVLSKPMSTKAALSRLRGCEPCLEDAADEAFFRGALDVEFFDLPSSITATRVSSVSVLMMTSLDLLSGRMRR